MSLKINPTTGKLDLVNSPSALDPRYVNITGDTMTGALTTPATFNVIGTTATDLPTYSIEFLDATGWTSIDWTGDWATGWIHTTGNTTVLSQSTPAVIGVLYSIVATVTGRTAGSFTIGFGGQTSVAITATYSYYPLAATTASLSITPTSDFDGKIVLSIKSMTPTTALVSYKTSNGTARSEIRTSNMTGSTIMGVDAGKYFLSTAQNNTVYGYQSMAYDTTGLGNTAIGFYALYLNTTGSGNIAVGTQPLRSNTTGGNNVGMGRFPLYSNTTGSGNIAIGASSLYNLTTGNNNTAFGTNSLYYCVTGSSNLSLGYYAGSRETGSNAFYVGNIAQTTLANDQAYSLLYGVFSGVAGSLTGQLLRVNGNLGVGGTPSYLLDVFGATNTQTLRLSATSGAQITGVGVSDYGIFSDVVRIGGRVALGTTTGLAATGGITVSELDIEGGGNVVKFFPDSMYGSLGYAFTYWDGSAVANAVFWDNTGKVGIGTTTPWAKLSLGLDAGHPGNLAVSLYSYFGTTYSQGASVWGYNAKAYEGATNQIVVANTNAGIGYDFVLMDSQGIRFHTIAGSVTKDDVASSERMRIDYLGNVGIGTTSPSFKLHAVSGSSSLGFDASALYLDLTNVYLSNNYGFIAKTSGGSYRDIFYASASNDIVFGSSTSGWADIQFRVGSTTPAMYIDSASNVGIGTTAPTAKLHILGSISDRLFEVDNATNGLVAYVTGQGEFKNNIYGSHAVNDYPMAYQTTLYAADTFYAMGLSFSVFRRGNTGTYTIGFGGDANVQAMYSANASSSVLYGGAVTNTVSAETGLTASVPYQIGMYVAPLNNGNGPGAGTVAITYSTGFNIGNQGMTGVHLAYGLNIESQTGGDWGNYAIYTNAGVNSLGDVLLLRTIKSGATQAGAGAAANEVWKTSGHATLPDNVLMIGV